MQFVALQLIALGTLAAVVVSAGLFWTRILGLSSITDRLGWAAALGLASLGQILLGLALCGWLSTETVLALAAAALILGGREAVPLARQIGNAWRRPSVAGRSLICVVACAGLAPIVLAALYPPHAWDETIYHLPMARAFAASGSMPFLAHLRVPVFPAVAELLDAALLLVAGDVATHGVSLLATVAVGGLLIALGRSWQAREAGWIAAAIHLGTPMVVYLSGLAYVDALLTLFVTAAFGAAANAIATGSRRWLVAAGAFAGTASSVKYLALYMVVWLALEVFVRRAGGFWARGRAVAIYGLAVAATALPTYARLVYLTGNPLFPFYSSVFGGGTSSFEPQDFQTSGFERVHDAALLAWRGVFARHLVGQLPPLSPFWLIAALALCLGIARRRSLAWTAAMVAGYTLSIPAHARYLLPILPIVGLLGASVLISDRRLSRKVLVSLCLALLLPGWIYAWTLCYRRGPLPTTPAARRAFLLVNVPGYGAVEFLNQHAPRGSAAYGLHLERLIYYADGVWLGDWGGPARFARVLPLLGDRSALEQLLRELGAQYFAAPRSSLPAGFRVGPSDVPVFDRDGIVVFALEVAAVEHLS